MLLAAFVVNTAVFALLYVLYSRENKARDVDPAGWTGRRILGILSLTCRIGGIGRCSISCDWQYNLHPVMKV
jgi:hypothetical protein